MKDCRESFGINPSVPNTARMYDYYLGGENNFPIDRETAEKVLRIAPWIRTTALENRAFLGRSVVHLTGEVGIRQFIDIGTGLPTNGNVHEVVHAIAPDARVAYVDNDPFVLAQSRALLARTDNVITIRADLNHPKDILDSPELSQFIDWSKPFTVLLVAVLHFVTDDGAAANILQQFRDVMAPGSHVIISHVHHQGNQEAVRKILDIYSKTDTPAVMRTSNQIAKLFEGFELLEPGLVHLSQWRPKHQPDVPEEIWGLCGVGRLRTPT